MEGHQLSPYDPSEFKSTNFCVHVETLPCCYHTSRAIVSPVLTNDGVISEKKALENFCNLIEDEEEAEITNPVTESPFNPYDQSWIRFCCKSALPSKIDPEKSFSTDISIVAFCDTDSGALLMVEKKDKHNCGMLTIYLLGCRKKFMSDKFQIVEQKFTDNQYSMLDQRLLLNTYLPNPNKDKLYVINTTAKEINKLEHELSRDSEQMHRGMTKYVADPNRLTDNLFSLFCGLILNINYHNSNTLFLSALIRSGIRLTLRNPIFLPKSFYFNNNTKQKTLTSTSSEQEEKNKSYEF